MGWYALYKWFKQWRKKPYVDWIQYYKDYLYYQWYNSLTEEERKRVDEKKEREHQNKLKRFRMLLGLMDTMISNSAYSDICHSRSKLW